MLSKLAVENAMFITGYVCSTAADSGSGWGGDEDIKVWSWADAKVFDCVCEMLPIPGEKFAPSYYLEPKKQPIKLESTHLNKWPKMDSAAAVNSLELMSVYGSLACCTYFRSTTLKA